MAGQETVQTNISLHIEERNIPLTLKLQEFPAVFLLECKTWA
jgi:hypothetical protein